ncbi:Uncharacterized protein FWK35_00020501 [Aphis craccivora]|uniref:Uncharacterized protein n=1 Tax=Aphis craccivora TaxID=307492 RepID=A0A6G0Z0Z2_APHCR|nr:Uncharacterized protein FWK35_00020501 [Aphis craccivora]
MLQFQTLGLVSDSKMNQVGALGSFQKRREKPKKNEGKTGIFTQNLFSPKSIFLYVSKKNFGSLKSFENFKFLQNLSIMRKFTIAKSLKFNARFSAINHLFHQPFEIIFYADKSSPFRILQH